MSEITIGVDWAQKDGDKTCVIFARREGDGSVIVLAELHGEAAEYVAQLEAERDVLHNTISLRTKYVIDVLKAENNALGELLSPLVDVELERDKLKEENEALRDAWHKDLVARGFFLIEADRFIEASLLTEQEIDD